MASSWKNKVIRNFERYAPQYDDHADIQKQIAASLVADLPERADDILEIGCGTGLLTSFLAEKYRTSKLHITDISGVMLERTLLKINHPRISSSVLDAETGKTGRHYDLIVGNMVCHWFEDLRKGLRNLSAMLNEGGRIFLTLPGPESFREWREALGKLSFPCSFLDFSVPQGVYRRDRLLQPVKHAYDFLQSVKKTGASSSRSGFRPLDIQDLKAACEAFDTKRATEVTWDILFLQITKKDLKA